MFKIQVEVNDIVVVAGSNTVLNMGGLNAFIDSLINKQEQPTKVAPQAPAKTIKRGRGRPAGAKNKRF